MQPTAAEPVPKLDQHPLVRRQVDRRIALEATLTETEARRSELIEERNRLNVARREAAVSARLNASERPPDADGHRLAAIDAELSRLDADVAEVREALSRHSGIERTTRHEAFAEQREQALVQARKLLGEMFDVATVFFQKQAELHALQKGPLKQARGFEVVSLPCFVSNYSFWAERALQFIGPKISRRTVTPEARHVKGR